MLISLAFASQKSDFPGNSFKQRANGHSPLRNVDRIIGEDVGEGRTARDELEDVHEICTPHIARGVHCQISGNCTAATDEGPDSRVGACAFFDLEQGAAVIGSATCGRAPDKAIAVFGHTTS